MSNIEQFDGLCVKSVPLINIYREKKSRYPMNNRGRWHHGLLFTLAGTETYYFRDRVVELSPNTALFIPKGETYRIELAGEESVVVCIDLELADPTELRPFCFASEKIGNLKALFYEAHSEWKNQTLWRDASVKATVYKILAALISAETARSPKQKKLEGALTYLHARYTDPDFSIETLAQIAGMSRRYFEKLFLAEMGVSPREYVINLRINLARELLLNEKRSVTDVTAELGYADVYHFSKLFKQKTGQSPAEYKQRGYGE